MKKYEIMYILRTDLSEEERQAQMDGLHKIITDLGGVIESVNTENWGLRNFAYPIDDITKGYYVVSMIQATNEALIEFERLAKLNTNVIRHLIVAK